MENKTVFVKTENGVNEISGHTAELYGDVKRILLLVDDKSNLGDITKRTPPSLRESLPDVLRILLEDGYISDSNTSTNPTQKSNIKIASPAFKLATPKSPASTVPVSTQSKSEMSDKNPARADLDFSFINTGDKQAVAEADKVKARALAEAKVFVEAKAHAEAKALVEAKARAKTEADKLKALQLAQIDAAHSAAKQKTYQEAKERAKNELAAKAKIEPEARLKSVAEAAQREAEQDALKARAELEGTRVRVESEVRARIEAEVRVKQEIEAVSLKAKKEAEKLRLELEAAKAKADAELKNRLEAEARVKAEVEASMKREAEAERWRIEKERVEQARAKAKAEAEIKMRTEAELRLRAEVETRLKAEVEERLKHEAETESLRIKKERAEIELARVKAETELRMRTEAELRIRAEVETRLKAEEMARYGDRRKSSPDVDGQEGILSQEVQQDQAELLKKSFVESFKETAAKQQKSSLFNFKLDTFSLSGKWKKADPSYQLPKNEAAAVGGSKVKAALEQRAMQEVEAQRIKAEHQALRIKEEQEAAARAKAEHESLRLKAEQEDYRLQVEQEEKRLKTEAEACALADQQAKQWEEAQRRAAFHAQAEKELLAKQSAQALAKSKQKQKKSPRKPIPLMKIFTVLFVIFLIVIAGLPYVMQLDEYVVPVEKEISAQLNQPVRIKKLHFALLPLPKLELIALAVGKGQELQVGSATVHFDISALFAATKSINKITLNKIIINVASLEQVAGWLQTAGGNEKYPVAHMELLGVEVAGSELKLPLINGRVDFDPQGKFNKAGLMSVDGKHELELKLMQNRVHLDLKIHEENLPVLPTLRFKDLSATGVIENGELIINDFFAHIHGGTLTGKGLLGWSNGWKLQSQLSSKSMELQAMFPNFGVTGELFGEARLTMYGTTIAQLNKEPRIEGNFEAKNGTINKLDIDTVARFGNRQGVAVSRTNFSQLTGTFKVEDRRQKIYINKILAGALSGSGFFDVDNNQQISGKLLVNIKGQPSGNVPLQLSGSLQKPELTTSR